MGLEDGEAGEGASKKRKTNDGRAKPSQQKKGAFFGDHKKSKKRASKVFFSREAEVLTSCRTRNMALAERRST